MKENGPKLKYPAGVEIKKKKYQDLLKLIQYIPPMHQQFFRDLTVDNDDCDELDHPDIQADTE